MKIHDLIDQCARRDNAAWALLWKLVEDSALVPVRRQLARWHFDATSTDDVMQELYRYLQADDLRCLRTFRGTTEYQLRGYLRTIANRFASRTLRKWDRRRRRELHALQHLPQSDRTGPTEEQIRALLRELYSIMSDHERANLQSALGYLGLLPDWPAPNSDYQQTPSTRTLRYRRQVLRRDYGDELT
jgi:hypothetical protein